MRLAAVVPLSAALLVVGCRSDEERAGTLAPPPPPAIPSNVEVPIAYDFTPLLQLVEDSVPRTFGSMEERLVVAGDKRKRFAYLAERGKFTAFMRDSLLHLRTRVAYRARAWYDPPIGPTLSASCGNRGQRPEIDLELVSPIRIDSAWRIRSQARLVRFEPVPGSRCVIDIARIARVSVTGYVTDAARKLVESNVYQVDSLVRSVDFASTVAEWWRVLAQPIPLREGVWLDLRPRELRLGRITGTGRTLTVEAGLDALPRLVMGPKPEVPTSPLPPLGRDRPGSGFVVVVDGEVDWPAASQIISTAVRGETVRRIGKQIHITSAAASPTNDGRMALDVGFAGEAEGHVRFVGRPELDVERAMIVVADLDYDVTTGDPLVRFANWLKGRELRALLRDRARVPVVPALVQGRELLEQGLNRTFDGVSTSARVDSVAVSGIFVTRGGLLVRVGAAGKARVVIREKR